MMKPKWSEEIAAQIVGAIEDGMIDTEICRLVGIGKTTLYRWENEHEELREAVKEAKSRADDQVEAALFKRAMGYEVTETEGEPVYDKAGKQTGIRVTKVRRVHVEPNVTAQIFWLKNRMPRKWRDRYERLPEEPGRGPLDLSKLSDEDLDRLEAIHRSIGGDGHEQAN